jgi:hypothetical protein
VTAADCRASPGRHHHILLQQLLPALPAAEHAAAAGSRAAAASERHAGLCLLQPLLGLLGPRQLALAGAGSGRSARKPAVKRSGSRPPLPHIHQHRRQADVASHQCSLLAPAAAPAAGARGCCSRLAALLAFPTLAVMQSAAAGCAAGTFAAWHQLQWEQRSLALGRRRPTGQLRVCGWAGNHPAPRCCLVLRLRRPWEPPAVGSKDSGKCGSMDAVGPQQPTNRLGELFQ